MLVGLLVLTTLFSATFFYAFPVTIPVEAAFSKCEIRGQVFREAQIHIALPSLAFSGFFHVFYASLHPLRRRFQDLVVDENISTTFSLPSPLPSNSIKARLFTFRAVAFHHKTPSTLQFLTWENNILFSTFCNFSCRRKHCHFST
jgi:hypothetical protein